MAIRAEEQSFFIETKRTMYQLKADEFGVLRHIWYGAKTGCDMEYLQVYRDVGFAGNIYEAGERRDYSLNTMLLEYPCAGIGDYRAEAVSAVHDDGSRALDLRYTGYKIKDGKYSIPGMPAVYGGKDAQTLEIYMRDTATGVEAVLKYGVLPELDIITRSVVIINNGSGSITLEKAHSLALDFPKGEYEWIHFCGRHAMERQPERAALLHGVQKISSSRGTSSHQENPAVIICSPDCTETSGSCVGAMLVYSGGFSADIEYDQLSQARLVMGIDPDTFSWKLEAGESFCTPEAVMCYSGSGFETMSHNFHKLIRENICRGKYKDSIRPVLINSWEAAYFDFDDEKLLDIAKQASELGCDMLVMDDGWFGSRNNDDSALGDWFVNEKKLNGGLDALTKKIKALGMSFGIWFEPEMVSEDSELYRAHPDWAIRIPGRKPMLGRYQLVLDITRAEVRDYLFDSVSAILSGADISYVKWDMNRSICDWYSSAIPAERMGEMPHRYVLALYDLLERLTTAFPDVLFEGCSGGGGRFDAGILYYSPQIWCSDNTDAFDRTKIQYGTSFFYPISAVGSHVSAVPNHQTGRVIPFDARAVTAMAGSFGYELDPAKLSEQEKQAVKEQIIKFKKYAPLIHRGMYYRLSNAMTDNYSVWEFVSGDRAEILVFGVIFRSEANMIRSRVRLRGADPEKMYRLEGTDRVYTGAALNEGGILLPDAWGDFTSAEFHFIAEN